MTAAAPSAANRLAIDRVVVTRPVWNRLETASDAVGLQENVLLHAGPPYADAAGIPKPVLNSACVAAVYEGLARNFDEAAAMIGAKEIRLEPSQDHDIVTPLAAVVSASMPLHAVYDAHRGRQRVFAPINGGNRPALRLGIRSEAVLAHIRWLNTSFAEVLDNGVAEGIDLLPMAVAGLAAGDDCHGRTVAATSLLAAELAERTPGRIADEAALEFLDSSPSIFLNLWMAATKCLLKLAEGIDGSSLVTAAGGNGLAAGIQISALPGRWFTAPATPPVGRFDAAGDESRALAAIGDSAIVEALGLGAMAIGHSPEQMALLGEFLPADHERRVAGLLVGRHPDFKSVGLRLGITASDVVSLGSGPVVGLGILDACGEKGRIGGGIYDMPVAPFAEALSAVSSKGDSVACDLS